MKKLAYIFGFILVCYVIFFDLNVGTIPTKHIVTVTKAKNSTTSLPKFEEIQVKNGDTVLGIVEQINPDLNKPITTISKDFSKLNNGQSPTKIQSGKSYKFPVYQSKK
jgi:hypothetical protein